jgi:predicted ferric reductase
LSALDLSSFAGLTAMVLLTINILLGLLISVRYNPVHRWPHRRLPLFQIHNWTAYIALGLVFAHPVLLLCSKSAGFRIVDVVWPLSSPGQRLYNCLGALAFYAVSFVVVTSYFRVKIGRNAWKAFHYVAYAAAALLFVHGLLIDPNLKKLPPDLLDGEKVLVEVCFLIILAGSFWRLRWGLQRNTAPRRVVITARELESISSELDQS